MDTAKVHEFLHNQLFCVVARTNISGGASAATVGFSHDEKFQFLIATNKATRKYTDITANHKVALVIGFEPPYTVQFEGVAQELTADELGERLEQHYTKNPMAREFAGQDGETYFLISPAWLRFRNVEDESETFEMREF